MIREELRERLVRAAEFKERVLRKLMPSRMNIVPYSFPLMPDSCPCDIHFCNYLDERKVRGRSIFHFGTGGHHVVGLHNWAGAMGNEILAITASPSECARYVNRVVDTSSLGRHYKVLFADIYDLSATSLPEFDLVTLFHLCEFAPRGETDRETRMDDAGLLELFGSKLTPQGKLMFYEGSFGHRETQLLVEQAVAAGKISFEERYKSLLVFRRKLAACGSMSQTSRQ
jgi:hypothetical protein